MKIVKVVTAKPFEYPFTCKCGSELVAEAADVRYGDFGCGYADDHDWKYYVTCPVCSRDHQLRHDVVPPNVQQMARAKRG